MSAPTAEHIAARIADRVEALPDDGGRRLIALAGPPAAGKSTVSVALVEELNRRGLTTGLVPMDGFHLDNRILAARDLLRRKGAPETFDLAGFAAMLKRLRVEAEVAVPTFDRVLDKSIGSSLLVTPDQRLAVVEGNYLLFDEAGWRDLSALWDFSVFLGAGEDELERRLVQRWLDHGMPPDAAQARALGNDIPNARAIMTRRCPADMVFIDGIESGRETA